MPLSAVTLSLGIEDIGALASSAFQGNMFGRSVVPQVASTSQVAPSVQRAFQTCRHRRLSGPRAAVATPDPVVEEQKMPSPTEEMPPNLNKYSRRITQPKSQGASQAMLYATGLTEEDMNKPQVTHCLCSSSYALPPGGSSSHECHCSFVQQQPLMHLLALHNLLACTHPKP